MLPVLVEAAPLAVRAGTALAPQITRIVVAEVVAHVLVELTMEFTARQVLDQLRQGYDWAVSQWRSRPLAVKEDDLKWMRSEADRMIRSVACKTSYENLRARVDAMRAYVASQPIPPRYQLLVMPSVLTREDYDMARAAGGCPAVRLGLLDYLAFGATAVGIGIALGLRRS